MPTDMLVETSGLKRDERVSVIHLDNGKELPVPCNVGLDHCTGDYDVCG